MASETLNALPTFPESTSVSAYEAASAGTIVTGTAPAGTAVATATVTGGSLTFAGLAADTEYVASASVSGTWKHIRFSTTGASDASSPIPSGGVYYADANNGSDSNDGTSWADAKLTIAGALALCDDGDTIYIDGKFREEITGSNLLGGISIIGSGTRPRHMDSPWPAGGAAWMPPTSPTAATPLLIIRGQGWHLENIMFDCPVDAPAVKLQRNALSGNDEYDASHLSVLGCRFTSGMTGIEDDGGCFNVLIDDCEFALITDSTGRAIYCSSTAVANPLRWTIRNSRFIDNDNHIVAAASKWYIYDCIFSADSVTSKINFTGGVAGNIVTKNLLGGTYSNAGGYTAAGAADEWGGNFNVISGGVTAADPA